MTAGPTIKEMRQSYPSCMTAIWYVEMFLCIPPEGEAESSWQILIKPVRGKLLSPNEVINHIQYVLQSEIGEPQSELPGNVIENILIQIRTPEFYSYIKGKMGAM